MMRGLCVCVDAAHTHVRDFIYIFSCSSGILFLCLHICILKIDFISSLLFVMKKNEINVMLSIVLYKLTDY